MATIEYIETLPFTLPLHEPLHWGSASVLQEVEHVLIRVVLSDGAEGWGEAPPRPTIYGETVESINAIVARELAPRLLGEELDPRALPVLHRRLAQIKNNQTAQGALDMALHHALATSQGQTLSRHLGTVQPRVRVSYILGLGNLEQTLAEAERVVAQGVRVLKVKIGRNWEEDQDRLARLTTLLGADVSLYADANECFDPERAAPRLAALAEAGLLYCEEPLPIELLQARSRLQRANILPLIADDSAFSPADLQRELALDTFHILNIKTARSGYTESSQMLSQARQAGKGVMVGSQASAGLGTVQAALFAGKEGVDHPCELSFFLKLKEDILEQPLRLEAGYLALANLDQIGVDGRRLRRSAVKGVQIR